MVNWLTVLINWLVQELWVNVRMIYFSSRNSILFPSLIHCPSHSLQYTFIIAFLLYMGLGASTKIPVNFHKMRLI